MIARTEPDYAIREQFHSEHKRIKIIHVGAGASGLLTAYKARRFLKNYELVCYEKYKLWRIPKRILLKDL